MNLLRKIFLLLVFFLIIIGKTCSATNENNIIFEKDNTDPRKGRIKIEKLIYPSKVNIEILDNSGTELSRYSIPVRNDGSANIEILNYLNRDDINFKINYQPEGEDNIIEDKINIKDIIFSGDSENKDTGGENGAINTESGTTDQNNGEIPADSGTTDQNNGEIPADSGATDQNNGEIPADSGATDQNNGEIPADSGATDQNNGEIPADSGATETESGSLIDKLLEIKKKEKIENIKKETSKDEVFDKNHEEEKKLEKIEGENFEAGKIGDKVYLKINKFSPGEMVKIKISTPPGKIFYKWSSEYKVRFKNPHKSETSFEMVGDEVIIVANFKNEGEFSKEEQKQLSNSYFPDLNNSFAKEYLETLIEKGAITGYKDGFIRPNNNTTRIEYLKIVFKTLGIDYSKTNDSIIRFKDIKKNTWQSRIVAKALELKIISYSKNTFKPNNNISRIEAIRILLIAGKIKVNKNIKNSSFKDVKGWGIKYVEKAKDLGIIKAKSNNFRPKQNITRAEASKIIVNFINKSKKLEKENNIFKKENDGFDFGNN